MNRSLKTFSVTAALLGFAAIGCTDPTVAPKSSVSSANVFNDPNAYRAFLAKIYGGLIVTGQRGPDGSPDIGLIDEGFGEYLRLYWYLQEMPTDEAVIGWNDPGLPDLNTGVWGASNSMVNAMYYRVFYQIMLVNEFLRQSTDAKLAERNQNDPTLKTNVRSEEHTSELQSPCNLVCRLLLEKKNKQMEISNDRHKQRSSISAYHHT